jgi:hypothetical protein
MLNISYVAMFEFWKPFDCENNMDFLDSDEG